jgi:hypothetical protein
VANDNLTLDSEGRAPSAVLGTIEATHSGDTVDIGLAALVTSSGAENSRVATLVGGTNPLPVITSLGTPVRTTVSDLDSNQEIAAASATRANLVVNNDSESNPLLLAFGATASASVFDWLVLPGQSFNMLRDFGGVFRGQVNGVWASNGSGSAYVSDIPAA